MLNLKKGDKIVAVDGHPLYFPTDLKNYLNKTPELKQVQFLIERDKEIFNLSCEVESKPVLKEWLHYGDENNYIDFYISEGMPCILRSRGENFSKILEEGIVFSCNGIRTQNLKHFSEVLETYDGQTLMFEFEHSQIKHLVVCQNLKLPVTLHPVQTIQRVGILFTQPMQLKHDTPWMQFKQAISSTVETLSCLINKNTDVKVQHLMGAPGIMRLLHRFSIDDFRRLIWFMVILNINLAILNLLPLPVLDGGHILFAFIEKLCRRPLPQKVIIAIQNVFVFFFLALMLYVIFFDLRRWQGDVEKEKEQQYIEKLTIPVNTR